MLIGEVSMVNDDKNDNRFYEEQQVPYNSGRRKPLYYLCLNTQKQSRCFMKILVSAKSYGMFFRKYEVEELP